MVFHYGQAIFEGLKAYRQPDGQVALFRPRLNFERVNQSNARMVIPPVDPDFCVHALKELLRLEADWVPSAPGTSLYTALYHRHGACLGVRPSHTYKFMSSCRRPAPIRPGAQFGQHLCRRRVCPRGQGRHRIAKTPGNYEPA
jgi:branched-chain amino acid aminotransferase